MPERLTCVVIDNEPFARRGLTRYVEDLFFLQLVGVGENIDD
ncbi:hypothetical protein [Rhizosphaericola mali]|nr:hypothetical protein [Rhizosphaericola mali]